MEKNLLLYTEEHLKCVNYDLNSDPIIREVKLEKGSAGDFEMSKSEIMFVISGEISISYEKLSRFVVGERKIVFFPPGSRLSVVANTDVYVVVCKINDTIRLCDAYTPEDLYREGLQSGGHLFPLDFNARIGNYIEGLLACVKDGLRCMFYLEVKIKELFFLLRAYYTKQELYNFFNPVLSNDVKFSQLIWNNYRKVGTVSEFASLCNYSTSRFKGKFKEVFGVSALNWLNNQRARNIYYDLKYTGKTLMEISDEYHFASTSYLSTFCKKNFEISPKEIRNSSRT